MAIARSLHSGTILVALLGSLLSASVPARAVDGFEWNNPSPGGNTYVGVAIQDPSPSPGDETVLAADDAGLAVSFLVGNEGLWEPNRVLVDFVAQALLGRAGQEWAFLYLLENGLSELWLGASPQLAALIALPGMTGTPSAVADETADENTILVGTDAGEVARTTDRGSSWTVVATVSPPESVRRIRAKAPDGTATTTALSADGALHTSTDTGLTWDLQASIPFSFANDFDVQTDDTQGSFTAIVGDLGSVVTSTDGGTSWGSTGLLPNNTLNAVSVWDGMHAVAVGEGGQAWWTQDAGVMWFSRATNTTEDLTDVQMFDLLHGYAVGTSGTFLYTSDSGLTWTELGGGPRHDWNAVTFGTSMVGFAGGNDGAWGMTTDRGLTWDLSKGNPSDDIHALWFGDAFLGYAGGSRGSDELLRRTTDGGMTWADQTFGIGAVRDLSFGDATNGMLGGDGGARVTTDAGANWSPTTFTDPVEAAHLLDATHGFLGAGSGLYETTDTGATWGFVSTSLADVKAIDFATSTLGVAVDSWGMMSRTTDGGATWMDTSFPDSDWFEDVHFPTAGDGFLVGFHGDFLSSLYRTTNGGATWDNLRAASGVAHRMRGVYFLDALEGVVVGDGGAIVHTTSGGVTAVRLSGLTATALPGGAAVRLSWTTSFESEHDGFHVYRAAERGGAWERRTGEMVRGRSPYAWTDSSVRPGYSYWYEIGAVDAYGHEDRYGPVAVTVPAVHLAEGLRGVVPNPGSGRSEVVFALASRRRVALTVHDVAGRRVRQLEDGVREAGQHRVAWDGRDDAGRPLGAGVYFVRLSGDGLDAAEKVVRLR